MPGAGVRRSTRRDYTYIDDVGGGIRAAIGYRGSAFEIVNLGNNRTVSLLDMIRGLERAFDRRADLRWLPPQPGDVPQTWASIEKARTLLNYRPATTLAEGLARFAVWYRAFAREGSRSDGALASHGS